MGAFSRNKGARAERPAGDWRPIALYPNYWVSRDGRVWSDKTCRLLGGLTSRDGYRKIHLVGESGVPTKQRFVHRLVAEAFVPGGGEQVRHIDGNKVNNDAANLAWGTCQENILDKWNHGKMPHGEGHHCHKVPVEAIPAIRASTDGNTTLGRKYGVSRAAIYAIKTGKSYAWVGADE